METGILDALDVHDCHLISFEKLCNFLDVLCILDVQNVESRHGVDWVLQAGLKHSETINVATICPVSPP